MKIYTTILIFIIILVRPYEAKFGPRNALNSVLLDLLFFPQWVVFLILDHIISSKILPSFHQTNFPIHNVLPKRFLLTKLLCWQRQWSLLIFMIFGLYCGYIYLIIRVLRFDFASTISTICSLCLDGYTILSLICISSCQN